MTDSTWAVGVPPNMAGYTPYGYYSDPNSWITLAVPNGIATFSGTYRTIAIVNADISVGGWSVSAVYQFAATAQVFFTGVGVVGGGGSVFNNTSYLSFRNASSAGFMIYANGGVMEFTGTSTASGAYISTTALTSFEGKSTAADATLVVEPGGVLEFGGAANGGQAKVFVKELNGLQGHLIFSGSGPGHHHKLTLGSIDGGGTFNLGNNQLTVGDTTDTTVSGVISGKHGRLVKVDGGRMTLTADNTYGGGTAVLGGELIVNGKIGNVTIGRIDENNPKYGWLVGDGSVGKIIGAYGTIAPGPQAYLPGLLKAKGLDIGDRMDFKVDIFDRTTAGAGGYDRLVVKGAVHLSGGQISIGNDVTGYDPVRHSLKVIDNDGKDKISGMFRGDLGGTLKEGDAIKSFDQVYSISYKGGSGNDVVLRSEGPVSRGTVGGDTINLKTAPFHTTTNRADSVGAEEGDDTVNAGGGNDTVDGYYGKDKLDGGKGVDLVYLGFAEGGDLEVTLKGGKWTTVKLDGQAWDKIRNFENVIGGREDDKLTGDGKANVIYGSSGKDTIKGGAGNDTLIGDWDRDKLVGGDGRDRFVFNQRPWSVDADKIDDFYHGKDKIVLDSRVFAAIGSKLTASELHSGIGAHDARDKDDHIIYDTKSGKLYYDPDGVGGEHAKLFATLTHHSGLLASDFDVIL